MIPKVQKVQKLQKVIIFSDTLLALKTPAFLVDWVKIPNTREQSNSRRVRIVDEDEDNNEGEGGVIQYFTVLKGGLVQYTTVH